MSFIVGVDVPACFISNYLFALIAEWEKENAAKFLKKSPSSTLRSSMVSLPL